MTMTKNTYPIAKVSESPVDGMIRFRCPRCNKKIKAPLPWGGRRSSCPQCRIGLIIPAAFSVASAPPTPAPVYDAIPAAAPPVVEPTVPLNLSIPKVGVSVGTHVTQKTADWSIVSIIGGGLVALGAVLAVWLGGKPPRIT
jgi:hypothetical protein